MSDKIIQVDLSNHPTYKDINDNPIERKAFVSRIEIDFMQKSIILYCYIKFYNNNGHDITSDFNTKSVILPATSTMMIVDTDENGEPIMETVQKHEIINGQFQYNQDNTPKMIEIEQIKMISFYDKLINFIDEPVPLSMIVTQYLNFNLDKFD